VARFRGLVADILFCNCKVVTAPSLSNNIGLMVLRYLVRGSAFFGHDRWRIEPVRSMPRSALSTSKMIPNPQDLICGLFEGKKLNARRYDLFLAVCIISWTLTEVAKFRLADRLQQLQQNRPTDPIKLEHTIHSTAAQDGQY